MTCLRNWHFAKPSLISLCSNTENCEECGDYVRHVFSFVPGSLAAISLLVLLLFHSSKTICKENGEICYYDTSRVIIFKKQTYYYVSVIWAESEGDFNKVAPYRFSGQIPSKFEHRLRRHKQRFGKIVTIIVLDKDEKLLWLGLQWHRSCHSDEMTLLPISLTAVYLGTGNCSSKIIQGSFFLQYQPRC